MDNDDNFFINVRQILEAQRGVIESELNQLNEEVTYKKALLRRLDNTLKATGVEPAPKPKPKSKPHKPNIGNIGKVLKFINDNSADGQDWTAKQISEKVGLHSSSVSKALTHLRETEQIRAVRRIQGGGWAYAAW